MLGLFLRIEEMSNDKQQPKTENLNNQFSNTEPLTHAQRVAIANKMSNNKRSSVVDWIEHQINQQGITHFFSRKEILQQAKAIEKQQRMSDFSMGIRNAIQMEATKDAEKWFLETFGGNNEQQ